MKKKSSIFLKHILSLLLCFQLFSLHQIRIGKIYRDYIPNDMLCSCLFTPNIHIIHAVIFEAVTDREIFKQFFISNVYNVLGTCFGELAFYNKVSHQHIFIKIIICDFCSLPKYLFFFFSPHGRLTVTWFAVACLYSF